jgi:phosphoglycerol transferase MdoB-like AlkP superfamily enzyme
MSEFDNGNNNFYRDTTKDVMSLGSWIGSILLTFIPCVGIILLFVWSFSGGTNENKKNWARAQLIVTAILYVLAIIVYVVAGAAALAAYKQAGLA